MTQTGIRQKPAAGEKEAVAAFQHSHADRNRKGDGTAKRRRNHKSCVAHHLLRCRKLSGELVAAHVNGENAGEKSRIQPQKVPDGNEGETEKAGEQRGEADDARHGKCRRSKQRKALLKPFSKSEAIASDPVDTAEYRADCHDPHNNLIHKKRTFLNKYFVFISVLQMQFHFSAETGGLPHRRRGRATCPS